LLNVIPPKLIARYQEDAFSLHTLSLLPHELQLTLSRLKQPEEWSPEQAGPANSDLAGQVSFFGIYDGHGGSKVSAYLKDNLPALIEGVKPEEVGKVIDWTQNQHKGYYKRWRGGGLHRWTKWAHALPPEEGSGMTLEERLTLAFLQVS
jgi:protein phosphatase PTC6